MHDLVDIFQYALIAEPQHTVTAFPQISVLAAVAALLLRSIVPVFTVAFDNQHGAWEAEVTEKLSTNCKLKFVGDASIIQRVFQLAFGASRVSLLKGCKSSKSQSLPTLISQLCHPCFRLQRGGFTTLRVITPLVLHSVRFTPAWNIKRLEPVPQDAITGFSHHSDLIQADHFNVVKAIQQVADWLTVKEAFDALPCFQPSVYVHTSTRTAFALNMACVKRLVANNANLIWNTKALPRTELRILTMRVGIEGFATALANVVWHISTLVCAISHDVCSQGGTSAASSGISLDYILNYIALRSC